MDMYLILLVTIIYIVSTIYIIKNNIKNHMFIYAGILLMTFTRSLGDNWYHNLCSIILECDTLIMLYLNRKSKIKNNN